MKSVPSSCWTDAVSEPKPALCFSFYLGSPCTSQSHTLHHPLLLPSQIVQCWQRAPWPPPSGCFNLPSWLTPSHSHCSPLSPISLRPSAAKSWLCWSQWQKSHTPRKPHFTGAVISTNSQRADAPVMDRVPSCWNAFLCTVHWLRMIP